MLRVLLPLYWKMYAFGYSVLSKLPTNAMRMVFGAALCLFGGHFFASVAAIEAFRIFGWEQLRHHVSIVVAEAQSVADASRKDNDVDEDENGVADVDEMTSRELLRHKTALAMSTVKDPQRLQAAAGFLWVRRSGLVSWEDSRGKIAVGGLKLSCRRALSSSSGRVRVCARDAAPRVCEDYLAGARMR